MNSQRLLNKPLDYNQFYLIQLLWLKQNKKNNYVKSQETQETGASTKAYYTKQSLGVCMHEDINNYRLSYNFLVWK